MMKCPTCSARYSAGERLCPVDGAVLDEERTHEEQFIGKVLDGKYRLDGFLSRGGMGAVFRGTHVMLNRPVAVKMIKPDLVTSPEIVRRFQREARAATTLNHPNVVNVYDLGQASDGTLYIVMELVSGQSLKEVIREGGALRPERIVRLLGQVCDGLSAAHHQQIVHRDLKPHNVMLTRDPRSGVETAKIVDFGIAKTFEVDAHTQLTAQGSTIGTPHYMSPEQAMGMDVDARSDIYSLGIILYETLTGEVPFNDQSLPAILVKHMSEAPTPPSTRRPDLQLPARLEAIALQCLAKRPADRFGSADDLATALRDALPASAAADVATIPMSAAAILGTASPAGGVTNMRVLSEGATTPLYHPDVHSPHVGGPGPSTRRAQGAVSSPATDRAASTPPPIAATIPSAPVVPLPSHAATREATAAGGAAASPPSQTIPPLPAVSAAASPAEAVSAPGHTGVAGASSSGTHPTAPAVVPPLPLPAHAGTPAPRAHSSLLPALMIAALLLVATVAGAYVAWNRWQTPTPQAATDGPAPAGSPAMGSLPPPATSDAGTPAPGRDLAPSNATRAAAPAVAGAGSVRAGARDAAPAATAGATASAPVVTGAHVNPGPPSPSVGASTITAPTTAGTRTPAGPASESSATRPATKVTETTAASPGRVTPAVQPLPANPSVSFQCRGAAELCSALRTAMQEALANEGLSQARTGADIALTAEASVVDERSSQQFGQSLTLRTYSIEMQGEADRLNAMVPMPATRTFSADPRVGAERIQENARVAVGDAIERLQAFWKRQ